ncbi:TylF/MycF/NovP-related O-methyltransferase [Jeotgalibacillus soli]|uniref:Macrocin-O-methyltransferase n=1 Tax=Jeotgalibacillus soli TaxID=889306 RepID=A0A0C2S7C7_9BACL|nr:TylF/MycF/NovP-related O-methyltransferase [Jeotgalibacillus soli]KIL49924.1 hypothetical protein KP78_13920 [Jeotgalibacillus soli]
MVVIKKVIFGTGRFAEAVLQQIGSSAIYAFLDNDEQKHGELFHNVKVYTPQQFTDQSDLEKYPIFIASSYYEDISKQLVSMGLIEGVHFFDGAALLSSEQLRGVLGISPDIEDEFIELYVKVKNYSMTSIERLYSLYQAVKYVVANDIRGDFVECGVWRGGSAMIIAETLRVLGVQDRHIYLYDTFEGMSQPSDIDIDFSGKTAEEEWSQSQTDSVNLWCYASLEDVQQNLQSTGYPIGNIHFVKGKVEETLLRTMPEQISLLRLDTDWYESTYHELENLYPLLSVNGVLIIDDYGFWQGARKAVNDYFLQHQVKILLNKIDFSGRLGIKN